VRINQQAGAGARLAGSACQSPKKAADFDLTEQPTSSKRNHNKTAFKNNQI
jgi:hypothetical protein